MDDGIAVDGHVVHKTDAAVLFYCDDLEEEVWFPLSAIEFDTAEESILVPRWLAKDRGLL